MFRWKVVTNLHSWLIVTSIVMRRYWNTLRSSLKVRRVFWSSLCS